MDKLETLLQKAASDASLRNSFYHLLLEENLFVPVNTDIPDGAVRFQKDGEADYTWAVANIGGQPTVPSFTSQDNVEDFFTKVTGWEGRFIAINGKALLQQLSGSEFLALEINPTSQYGVSLPQTMIRELVGL